MRSLRPRTMTQDEFGTVECLKSLHADLYRKYVAHCGRIDELWRSFTPSQREKLFRAGADNGQVLEDSNDRSMGRVYAVVPELNVSAMRSTPDHFLDHFEFRAVTSLLKQYNIGLEDAEGDYKMILNSISTKQLRLREEYLNEITFFIHEEKYGDNYTVVSPDKYEQVVRDFTAAFEKGDCVPRSVGELIIERQSYMIKTLGTLVEDILSFGAELDEAKSRSSTPREKAQAALSLSVTAADITDVYSEEACIQDLLTAAYNRKVFFEVAWNLCRSDPSFLTEAVKVWHSSRPELVPDEKGRRLRLATDDNRYILRSIFEVLHDAVVGTAVWDIFCILVSNFLDARNGHTQSIVAQEIANICKYESDRIRARLKRVAQVGIGQKFFKRLSNVFDNATPRISLKTIPNRLSKDDLQLHAILSMCQFDHATNGQSMRNIDALHDLYRRRPLEEHRLKQSEFDALGQVSITSSIIMSISAALRLPAHSPKKGLIYVSKLKEVAARLDFLKAQITFGRGLASVDDLQAPNLVRDILNVFDKVCEVHAGGSMIRLYQQLNREYLQDLESEVQMAWEAKSHPERRLNGVSKQNTEAEARAQEQTNGCVEKANSAGESGISKTPSEQKLENMPCTIRDFTDNTIETMSTSSDTTQILPEVFRVSCSALRVFRTLFPEHECNCTSQPRTTPDSIEWVDFGAAMIEIGFEIIPSVGLLYSFKRGENFVKPAEFFTLHRPYRETIKGNSLMHLAARLEKLYGWGGDSFESL